MTDNQTQVFEELAVDVYDEVDRRETDVLWNKTEVFQLMTIVIGKSNTLDHHHHGTVVIVVLPGAKPKHDSCPLSTGQP